MSRAGGSSPSGSTPARASAQASESPTVDDFERELDALRQRVDTIDVQLLGLFNARASVVADIYALKRRHGVRRLDRSRTEAILDRLAEASAGPLPPQDVRAIFEPLLRYFVERYAPPDEAAPTADASGNRGSHP